MLVTVSELEARGLYRYLIMACRCGLGDRTQAELGVLICSNGVRQYKFRCCGCGATSGSIAHNGLPEEWRLQATVIAVHEPSPTPPCERCGSHEPTTTGLRRQYSLMLTSGLGQTSVSNATPDGTSK
jgi:hypothetical protein